MSLMLARARPSGAWKFIANFTKIWNEGSVTPKPRAFQSSTKPMGSAGLAHAPSPQSSPDFIYDKHNDSTFGAPFRGRMTPPIEVSSSVPIATRTSPTSTLAQNTDLEAQEQIPSAKGTISPMYHHGSKYDRTPYWQNIHRWKDVGEKEFLSYSWNIKNDVQGEEKLFKFLKEVLPERMPDTLEYEHIQTRQDFLEDVFDGIALAPMSIRLTPHILASIDWNDPLGDPLSRQFIPKKSQFQPDHPKLELDPNHETKDSAVPGLVHRYPDKCLFLASSHCPLYCRFCTRSWSVGADTETVIKCSIKPGHKRWDAMLKYIAATPAIQDVVISGGDSYSLEPHNLSYIGSRLLRIPHVRRFRVATKGLCVHPSRTLDPDDDWTDALIRLSNEGRLRGKEVAMHTHFNHPNEISWVSREAAQKLFVNGLTVRNQTVLLKGVNDDVETMGALIRELGDNNIKPYYVYAGDMIAGVEDLRTPLSTALELEKQLRGFIGGFNFPAFIVDLPGGGGKRLAASYETYDRTTGRSTFVAPAIHGKGKEGRVYEYYDPLASLPNGSKGIDFGAKKEWRRAMEVAKTKKASDTPSAKQFPNARSLNIDWQRHPNHEQEQRRRLKRAKLP